MVKLVVVGTMRCHISIYNLVNVIGTVAGNKSIRKHEDERLLLRLLFCAIVLLPALYL